MEIVSVCASLLPTIDKFIIEPLTRRVSYAFSYAREVAELRRSVERLAGARDNLQNSVDDASRRGDEIQKNVEKWLVDASKAIEEAEKLIQGEEEAMQKRCFAGLCPNLKVRYQLGKKSVEEALAIASLENEGKFDISGRISHRPAPQQIVSSSARGFEGLPSRASILEKVLAALTDPNVNILGVSGMGGTGKTTLAKEVHKQAIERELFDVVATVTLSEKAELEKIQENIADVLGLKLEEKTLDVRANRLRQRLLKENKVLIILDNLWEKIDFENLGIPLSNKQWVSSRGGAAVIEQEENDAAVIEQEEKDDLKRCTILLTSRNRDMLTCYMGVQKEFMLDVLPKEESWTLFERTAGDLKITKSIAIEVAKKCAGLPLLLVTVASALKNKEIEVWKDILKRLSMFEDEEMQAKVYSVLELSYDRLASEEVKSLFLLCGLFTSPDILILDLLKYSLGLGLLKHIYTVQDARNRVHKLIGDLKSSCLLLDSEKDGCVRIHDVVQDVAASIASRAQLAFKKVGGPQEDCQRVDVKCFPRIFLEHSDISEFPLWLQCPEIEFFRLSVRDPSVKIPDSLFEGITKLKVLNFTGMHFSSLPLSLGSVTRLHTLCLDRCILHDISVIWQLKNLEVLSLMYSEIVELPRDLKQLTRLKLLDLSNCAKLEFIPENVLSCLSLLEELYMGNSFACWEVKQLNEQSNASLSELEHLSRLTNLEIDVPDARKLPKGLFCQRLERFKISIGGGWHWRGRYQTSRTLKLKLHTSIHSWDLGVKTLLKKAEDLYLDEVKGVRNVLYDLHKEGFPQLKHLVIQNGGDIRHIIDSEGRLPFDAFPVLESLSLHNLSNLEKICRGQLMAGDFCQLRILRVRSCNKLKHLFPFSAIRKLKLLREMEVMDCSDVEEIFAGENEVEEEYDKIEEFEFTRLSSLKFQLPLLRRFCSKVKSSSPASTSSTYSRQNQSTIDPRQPLFNEMIVFLNLKELKLSSITAENIWWNQSRDHSSFCNLTSLVVEACRKINYLFTSAIVRNLGQLQRLEICECKLMEGVIATAEGETISKTSFPKLEFLKFKGLPKLIRFCNGDFLELPCLKELRIANCRALKSFISNPIAATTSVANLAFFDEKVAFPNLELLRIEDMNGLKMIWRNELHEGSFCKLKSLTVRGAGELVNVFPSNMLMSRFLNLECLSLSDCGLLEEVFDLPTHEGLINFSRTHGMPASQLKYLWIKNLPNLKHIWKKDAQEREIIFFQKLQEVNVFRCPSLKSIFPSSVATCLLELKALCIGICRIVEIVDGGEDTETIPRFEFPQLTTVTLYNLKELKTLYPGTHTSDWPMLEKLEVHACPQVEIFSLESGSIGGNGWRSQSESLPFFIVEKVIPNLEELTLNSKDAKLILNGHCPEHLFDKVRFLHLQRFDEESASFLFALLRRFPNLENLEVKNNWLQELFSSEGLINEENQGRTIARIRHMKLDLLYKLKRVCKQDCRLGHMFESLETLEVWRCDNLISLVPSINSPSFGNLSHLDVWNCEGLLNLVTFLTAPFLGLLTRLSIRECSKVKEVVAREEDGREDQVTLGKLTSLKLHCLSSLTYFCAAYHTFNFPSLEEVIVTRCPKMKAFSRGVSITPKLERVKLAGGGNDIGRWGGDLNITIQQLCAELVGLDGVEHLELSEHPQLKEKWHNEEFPVNYFSNLRSLTVDEVAPLSAAIPPNLFPFLDNLLELEVKNCDLVEEVFDLILPNAGDGQIGTLPKVTKLQLIDLPRLKHAWNEEPKGFCDFKNLNVFKVHNCAALRYIFTPTTCLGLVQLRELEVKECPLIEEIISKEATPYNVVFPLLCSIALERLPNLTSFYLGSGTVRCPSLQKITLIECSSALTSTFLNEAATNATNHTSQAKIVFPSLKELELFSIRIEEIWNSHHIDQSSCLQHLTTLIVEDCENLRYLFTSSMVEYLNQIKRLDICNCKSIEEVVSRQGVNDGESSSKMLLAKVEVLKLEGLPKLTTFCTCSLFVCPVLKKLQIDNCPQLKSLIADPASADVSRSLIDKCDSPLFDDKVAFPDLEELRIGNMYRLKTIWHNELHEDSFCRLRILRVEQAEALQKVFPSSMLRRRFQNLEKLVIEDCESLEEVFDIQALMISVELTHTEAASQSRLKTLNIKTLPNLKHVWNQDPRELLSFQNLSHVVVWRCPNLRSLFPASVARGLPQLECLNIDGCGIEEIVEEGEGEETTAPAFVFPKLDNLVLWRLPELKRFYPGRHTSEWPALKKLSVYHCDKMHTLEFQKFPEEEEGLDRIQVERPSLFSFQEVLPRLEALALTCKEARMIWEDQFPEKLFHNLKALQLQCFHDKSAVLPYDKSVVLPSGLLERFPCMGQLFLRCNERREIFPHGLIGEGKHPRPVPQIRHLRLNRFPNAMRMRDQEPQIHQLLQNLDVLEVWRCNGLTNLAPFSASFQSITSLDIFMCRALVHLFTLSTAETLVQLSKMRIRNCDLVTEIVASIGQDTNHEIVFYKLQSLELHHLPSLICFCSGEHGFKFPSLTEAIVSKCPKMEIFSKGVLRTPKLQSVKLTQQKDKERWNSNLNTTIQHLYKKMVGFHGLQDLRLINFRNLKDAWHSELPVECFYDLRSLVVENCASFSNAMPSSLLSFLNRLKELEVRNCDSLVEVFCLEGLSANLEHPVLSKLNKLLLSDLSRLRHIWNKGFCGILDFRNLKLLKVHNCSSLKYIFTPTMALSLVQIQELEVKNCDFVREIITSGKDEAVVDTVFSQLSSLVLESLPNLTCFCSSTNVLEFQSLEKVTVVECPRVETFASTILGSQETNMADKNEESLGQEGFGTTVLLFGGKVTCRSLKVLKVECNSSTKELLLGNLPTECFAKIKVLKLTNFPHEETLFPSDILLRLPSLEKLIVNDARFEELFLEQRIVDKETNDQEVTNLRQLKLSKLPKLSQLFQDHSIPDLMIQNLETLEVIKCIGLKILMPSSLSFQNLTTLKVSKCHGLTNLMTSSTAKSLEKLTRMSITECDMLEEIVASEGNEGEDEIAFSQLKHLGLHCLPILVGFSSGNQTFNFPSLEEVTLIECSKMKFFSEGALFTPRLTEVQIALDEDKWRWEGSLNTTVQQWFSEMGVGNAQGH